MSPAGLRTTDLTNANSIPSAVTKLDDAVDVRRDREISKGSNFAVATNTAINAVFVREIFDTVGKFI